MKLPADNQITGLSVLEDYDARLREEGLGEDLPEGLSFEPALVEAYQAGCATLAGQPCYQGWEVGDIDLHRPSMEELANGLFLVMK